MPGVHWPPEFPPSVIIGVVAASCRDVVDDGCDWTCVVVVGDDCTVVVGAAVVDCTVVVGAVGADCVVAVGVALIDCDAVVGVAVDDCTDVVGAVVVDCAELVCAAAIVWNFAFSVCGGIFAGVGLAVVDAESPISTNHCWIVGPWHFFLRLAGQFLEAVPGSSRVPKQNRTHKAAQAGRL